MKNVSKPVEKPNKKRGIALVTVLAVLTLAAVMIMAFFSLSRNELTSSTAYSHGIEAQQLAQTAVNIVMHQIRSATSDNKIAWSSQPGMIRTYDASGFKSGFKLYSDDEMLENSETGLSKDYTDLKNWDSDAYEAIFVDLNQPVLRDDEIFYPIVDPRAKQEGKPSESVEGFDYDTTDVGEGPSEKALPMPVKWLYQLEDGTLGYLALGGRFERISGAGEPSRDNPMVARLAFWTDDETAKVNVNTAAGGRSWDTPRAGGITDRNYGSYQPLQREYQRYPAHPATTSLVPILFPNQQAFGQQGFDPDANERIYELTPRVVGGGSLGGSYATNVDPPPLQPDKDRLYATLDEFIFDAPTLEFDSNGNITRKDSALPQDGRENQLLEHFKSTKWRRGSGDGMEYVRFLDKLKFFLTTSSRAPETTVFNTPRISVWPSHYADPVAEPNYFSAFDRRIRFCAELGRSDDPQNTSPSGKGQYHFQREDSGSTTHDYEQINRNKQLYSYMQWLTEQDIPGVGNSLEDKYGDNRDQILTEIFDYVRSLNLFDDSLLDENNIDTATPWKSNPSNHYAYTNYRVAAGSEQHQQPGHGQVAPIEIDAGNGPTKGFGRIHSIMEAGFAFICTAEGNNTIGGVRKNTIEIQGDQWVINDDEWQYSNVAPLNPATKEKAAQVYASLISATGYAGTGAAYWDDTSVTDSLGRTGRDNWEIVGNQQNWNRTLPENTICSNNEKSVQGMILFQGFCPSQGWTAINADFRMEVGVSGFSLDGKDLEVDGDHTLKSPFTQYLGVWGSRDNGGVIEPRCFLVGDGENGNRYFSMARYATWNLNGNRTDENGNRYLLSDDPSRCPNPHGPGNRNGNPVSDSAATSYPFVTRPMIVDKNSSMDFSGGTLDIKMFPDDGFASDSDNPNSGSSDYSQRVVLQMKSSDLPTPDLLGAKAGEMRGPRNDKQPVPNTEVQPRERWTFHREGAFQGNESRGGRLKAFIAHEGRPFLTGDDVTRSYVIRHGDTRLAHAQKELESSDTGPTNGDSSSANKLFVPHPDYDSSSANIASNFTYGNAPAGYGRDGKERKRLVKSADWGGNDVRSPHLSDSFDYREDNLWGDFDNTMALELDGPYINKPDEGNSRGIEWINYNPDKRYGAVDRRFIPYFNQPWTQEPAGASYWSPNRIMPGPGMFGSLPTGVKTNEPWQTLLFRPLPNSGQGTPHEGSNNKVHPGYESPKDHYFLDFFWMPVVEPWSISEPVSTAGKVNLNYAIQPFSHITRSSGVRAVFASEEMLTVPNNMARDYTAGWGWGRGYDRYLDSGGSLRQISLRSWINAEETLKQFEEKFDNNEIFRSASELCEVWFVPEPVAGLALTVNLNQIERLWDPTRRTGLGLVGDNSRERPYTNTVPRFTTKSNTFQVHYRAQIIHQSPLSPTTPSDRRSDAEYEIFDPSVDEWVGEYRGSTIIERYVDPEDPRIPDYAVNPDSPSLDNYYRFRVVSTKRFAP